MIFRCPECRTRRADYGLFTKHLRETGHRVCSCGGYHYPHRANSPCCEKNPMSTYWSAIRAGVIGERRTEIFIDAVWEHTGKPVKPGDLCPF